MSTIIPIAENLGSEEKWRLMEDMMDCRNAIRISLRGPDVQFSAGPNDVEIVIPIKVWRAMVEGWLKEGWSPAGDGIDPCDEMIEGMKQEFIIEKKEEELK